jgi:hypothetical protein
MLGSILSGKLHDPQAKFFCLACKHAQAPITCLVSADLAGNPRFRWSGSRSLAAISMPSLGKTSSKKKRAQLGALFLGVKRGGD